MKICEQCGCGFTQQGRYGWGKRTYCYECRPMKRVKKQQGALCAGGCGKLVHISAGSLPPGKATCRQCRGYRPVGSAPRKRTCADCAGPSYGVRCRACMDASHGTRGERAEAKRLLKLRRYERDRQAPGPYTPAARRHLLVKWQKQGRECAYCHRNPAEQVDHIIPLALGGTNYEGNLAPACADCNRRKMDNLLSAWRYGIQVRKWRTTVKPRPPAIKVQRKIRQSVSVPMSLCALCGALHVRPKYCSDACSLEAGARAMRDRYRESQGLLVDPSRPTRPSRRVVVF